MMQSESLKRFYANETPEHKALRCEWMKGIHKGYKHTEEAKAKIREARKHQKQVFDEKARRNMSEAAKRAWANKSKEQRDKDVQRFVNAGKKNKETSIEVEVERQLKELGINYEKQKKCYNRTLGRSFVIDFWLPDNHVMIECNGDYWHNLESRKKRDEALIERVNAAKIASKKYADLKLVILWEHEIKSNPDIVGQRLRDI